MRMEPIFYRPENAWAGDFIPFFHDGVFHLFYLHDWRNAETYGMGVPWYQISTRDFVHFQEHGEMLAREGIDSAELCIFTGCVIRAQGRFHIFYTGHNHVLPEKGEPMQRVLHAVSDDLMHWEKLRDEVFLAPVEMGYEPNDWRDPFVFEKDGTYHMLLAARRNFGPAQRRGVTALATSTDLKNWTLQEPLWSPESYVTHECPDYFRMGEWEYLIYSEYSDIHRTRYVMRQNEQEPWVAPRDDQFDTQMYYAAKSCADDQGKRYLFGWNATREGNRDKGAAQWGGNLVVHELHQRADGTLAVREPASLAAQFRPQKAGQAVTVGKPDGMTLKLLGDELPEAYRMRCVCRMTPGARRFGLVMRYDEAQDIGMGIFFEPGMGQMYTGRVFDPISADTMGMNRPMPTMENGEMELILLMDHTNFVLYAGSEVALTGRVYEHQGLSLAGFAEFGQVEFNDVEFQVVPGADI